MLILQIAYNMNAGVNENYLIYNYIKVKKDAKLKIVRNI